MNTKNKNMKKEAKYCQYCGTKLEHRVSTDINTKLVCKYYLCKKSEIEITLINLK